MVTNCSFCQLSTAGQHEAHCPMNQFYTTTFVADAIPTITRIGWECPVCGCAWAPWVSGCEKCNKHDRVFNTMEEMIESMDPTKETAEENQEGVNVRFQVRYRRRIKPKETPR